jgi:hypothetical protein
VHPQHQNLFKLQCKKLHYPTIYSSTQKRDEEEEEEEAHIALRESKGTNEQKWNG